ncbi:hypothetical protein HDE_05894 [Halotydeus destructor]|nr:hypothetical protein HDE_05894 [Halotydeus destructor]
MSGVTVSVLTIVVLVSGSWAQYGGFGGYGRPYGGYGSGFGAPIRRSGGFGGYPGGLGYSPYGPGFGSGYPGFGGAPIGRRYGGYGAGYPGLHHYNSYPSVSTLHGVGGYGSASSRVPVLDASQLESQSQLTPWDDFRSSSWAVPLGHGAAIGSPATGISNYLRKFNSASIVGPFGGRYSLGFGVKK